MVKLEKRKMYGDAKTGIKAILHSFSADMRANRKRFLEHMEEYNSMNRREGFRIKPEHIYPILTDWSKEAGGAGAYFFQDLWAAKKIFQNRPQRHFDIGSRLDGFILSLLSFMEVTMIDIRPLTQQIELIWRA